MKFTTEQMLDRLQLGLGWYKKEPDCEDMVAALSEAIRRWPLADEVERLRAVLEACRDRIHSDICSTNCCPECVAASLGIPEKGRAT